MPKLPDLQNVLWVFNVSLESASLYFNISKLFEKRKGGKDAR